MTDAAAKVLPVRAEVERPAGSRPVPDLSVVICTLGRAGVADTAASVAESAAAAGRRVEVLVSGRAPTPRPTSARRATVSLVFPAGLAYARNRGAELAQAPVVAFVDDDEVVDLGWVGAVLTAFDEVEAAGVFGPVAPRDERGLPYCRYDGGGELRVVSGPRALPWTVGTGGNMAFRRADLLAVGGFDVLFGLGAVALSAEDTELIFRLLRSGRPVAWSPDVIVYHPSKTASERLASRYPYAFGIGKLARRHGDPVLAARYAKSIIETLGRAVRARDGRRLRETRETLRGFVAGVAFRARPASPAAALARMPDAVRDAIGAEEVDPLELLYRPDPHFMYRVGAAGCCISTSTPRRGCERDLRYASGSGARAPSAASRGSTRPPNPPMRSGCSRTACPGRSRAPRTSRAGTRPRRGGRSSLQARRAPGSRGHVVGGRGRRRRRRVAAGAPRGGRLCSGPCRRTARAAAPRRFPAQEPLARPRGTARSRGLGASLRGRAAGPRPALRGRHGDRRLA